MGSIFDEFNKAYFDEFKTAWQSPFTKKYFIDGIAYDRPIIDAREDNVVTSVKKIWAEPTVANAKLFLAPIDWAGTIDELKESFGTFDGLSFKPIDLNFDDIYI